MSKGTGFGGGGSTGLMGVGDVSAGVDLSGLETVCGGSVVELQPTIEAVAKIKKSLIVRGIFAPLKL